MSTIDSPAIIRAIIKGHGWYPGDEHLPPVVRIVKFTNAWGRTAYGTETARELGRYAPSEFIIDSTNYWTKED